MYFFDEFYILTNDGVFADQNVKKINLLCSSQKYKLYLFYASLFLTWLLLCRRSTTSTFG
jgi:hypothetical protein